MVRRYEKTIPACYKCATVSHWVDSCPNPDTDRCNQCGKTTEDASGAATPRECQPTCLICTDDHLSGSAACEGKFKPAQKSYYHPAGNLNTASSGANMATEATPLLQLHKAPRPTNGPKKPRRELTSGTSGQLPPTIKLGELPALDQQ
ncbi:hypothetical protein MTO96_009334 [Rhipicephalus appendiculatus]